MSEEVKEMKEIDPVEEYLNNYKEQKLAEFCVQKDIQIANYKRTQQELIKQNTELRSKADKHDKTWASVKNLYVEIKKLSVDDYLMLYHMMSNDICNNRLYPVSVSSVNSIF